MGSFLGVHYRAGFSRLDLLDVHCHLAIPEHLSDALVEGGMDTLILRDMKCSGGLIARVLVGADAEKYTKEGVKRSDRPSDLGREREVPKGSQSDVESTGSGQAYKCDPLQNIVRLVVHQSSFLEMLSHHFSSLREALG